MALLRALEAALDAMLDGEEDKEGGIGFGGGGNVVFATDGTGYSVAGE